jgi:hypothetical protein
VAPIKRPFDKISLVWNKGGNYAMYSLLGVPLKDVRHIPTLALPCNLYIHKTEKPIEPFRVCHPSPLLIVELCIVCVWQAAIEPSQYCVLGGHGAPTSIIAHVERNRYAHSCFHTACIFIKEIAFVHATAVV